MLDLEKERTRFEATRQPKTDLTKRRGRYTNPVVEQCWQTWIEAKTDAVPSKEALRTLIEGMSVSVDVSTGDEDLGRRLFGKVAEVMDCDGDKHDVTLLVYSAEPNWKGEAGTEPVPGVPVLRGELLDAAEELVRIGEGYEDEINSSSVSKAIDRLRTAAKACRLRHDPQLRKAGK